MLKKSLILALLLAAGAQAGAQATKPERHRIALVLFRGCEDACKGFKEYWTKRGIPVDIDELDAGTDVKKLRGFVEHVKRSKPDLLVTWGTTVALEMLGPYDKPDPARYVTQTPALFMIASTPVGSKLVPNLQSSGRNISGTLYLPPVTTQLRAAQMYLPFKRIGFLWNPKENNSAVIHADLVAAQQSLGYELVKRMVPLNGAGEPDKLSLPRLVNELADQKVDMVYMSPDTFLMINRNAITETAVQRGVPVLATAETAVLESSALLGVVNRYYTVGQLTAAKAERILVDKVAPQDIAIEAPPNFTLIVNMAVARQLKRYPPIRVLKIADVVKVKP